jgi:RNA polymerase sigma factor for flagellar operon FliA
VRTLTRRLESARKTLQEQAPAASPEVTLAKAMKLPRREVERAVALAEPVRFASLDRLSATSRDSGRVPLADTLKDPKVREPQASSATEEEKRLLGNSILKLPDPERLVVTLHYYKGMMFREIARLLKLSASRVAGIHKQAVNRLRTRMVRPQPG